MLQKCIGVRNQRTEEALLWKSKDRLFLNVSVSDTFKPRTISITDAMSYRKESTTRYSLAACGDNDRAGSVFESRHFHTNCT
jgi:hypothetical protein